MNELISLIAAAPARSTNPVWFFGIIGAVVLLFLFVVILLATRYRRCPSNRILVIYGKVGSNKASKCLHGGGTFVWPLI